MGKKFGQLAKIRGVIHYKLSPYEQNVFAGVITKSIPNWIRRIREEIFFVAPPLIAAYLIYDWGNKEYLRLQRKKPEDYANDE